MSQLVPLVVIGAMAVVALVALQFTPAKMQKRRARATKRVAVRDLTPGAIAKVRGTVVLDEVLESPVTQKRCACWRVDASYQQRSHPENQMRWYLSVQRETRRDFRLQDETGTVRVATQLAVMDLLPSVKEHRNDELPAHLRAFLTSNGVPSSPKSYLRRFEEWAVTEGAELEVTGQVRSGLQGPELVAAPGKPVVVAEDKPDWL